MYNIRNTIIYDVVTVNVYTRILRAICHLPLEYAISHTYVLFICTPRTQTQARVHYITGLTVASGHMTTWPSSHACVTACIYIS